MRFTAKLSGVDKLERPEIIHSNYKQTCTDWAKVILKRYPNAKVEVYELVETHVDTIYNADGNFARTKNKSLNDPMPWPENSIKPEDVGRRKV